MLPETLTSHEGEIDPGGYLTAPVIPPIPGDLIVPGNLFLIHKCDDFLT